MTMDYFKSVDMQLRRKTERFKVDYTKIERGLYVCGIFDDVTVYDLLTRTPNSTSVMDSATHHSLCHVFDSYIKDSQYADKVISFSPSESGTGFKLIVRGMDHPGVILLLRRAFEFIRDFTGEMPKNSAEECPNYKEHNLDSARKEATLYLPILNRWEPDMMVVY